MQLRLTVLLVSVLACAPPRRGDMGSTAARPPLTLSEEQLRVAAATISAVIASLPTDSTAVCVTLAGPPPATWYSPSAALLGNIDRRVRRVVGPGDCPPTYDSMIALVGPAGRQRNRVRPPGYIDPYRLIVSEQLVVRPDSNILQIELQQGTWHTYYQCVARSSAVTRWGATCRVTGRALSTRPPNESLQLTSASRCGGIAVEWLERTQTRRVVSRLDGRPLAAEL